MESTTSVPGPYKKNKKKDGEKLVVVLGMHRSGTSAVTRGLQVLGAEFGNNLLPIQIDNPTGYWEDKDLDALNIEILESLGRIWHSVSPLRPFEFDLLRNGRYFLQAVELLREKMAGSELFAYKNPRLSILLPFWKEVFLHNHLDVKYVLTIRHPLSVCKSLAIRDNFNYEKSYFLWESHVISSLVGTRGEKAVLVDYDMLMEGPETELKRISKELGLEINQTEFEKFSSEFLDANLRHTVYSLHDLDIAQNVPTLVPEIYSELLGMIKSPQTADNLDQKTIQWSKEFSRLDPAMFLIDELTQKLKSAVEQTPKPDHESARLQQVQVENERLAAEREGLSAALVEKDKHVQQLIAQLEENSKTITIINGQLAENAQILSSLKAQLDEKSRSIGLINQKINQLELKNTKANKLLVEKEKTIQELLKQLSDLVNSDAWNLVLFLWNIRLAIAPHNSSREGWLENITRALRPIQTWSAGLSNKKQPEQQFLINNYFQNSKNSDEAPEPEIIEEVDESPEETVEEINNSPRDSISDISFRKRHEIAVILHLYYGDLWQEFSSYLSNLNGDFDLYITIPEKHGLKDEVILRTYPEATIYHCENRGRDIAPFIELLTGLFPLDYKLICKIHTKKSTHRRDGSHWRNDILEKLLGSPQKIAGILDVFDENPKIGIIAAQGHLLPYNEMHWSVNMEKTLNLATRAHLESSLHEFNFAAGSMFWFRPQVLNPIISLKITKQDFEVEKGQLDGTMAHAFERFFGLLAAHTGYKVIDTGAIK